MELLLKYKGLQADQQFHDISVALIISFLCNNFLQEFP